MNYLTDAILAILLGAGLMLCGAESKPWNPWWNVAGLALFAFAALCIFLSYRRRQ